MCIRDRVRASIALSYFGLDDQDRATLRVLGLLGLPDFPAWVIATALDIEEVMAEAAIERLVDAQLVDFACVDDLGHLRYRIHDLIRLYARERAEVEQDDVELREAVSRVVGSWLWFIEALRDSSAMGQIKVRLRSAQARQPSPELVERVLDQPRSWLTAEHDSLVRAVEVATERGLDQHASDLATALSTIARPAARQFQPCTSALRSSAGRRAR